MSDIDDIRVQFPDPKSGSRQCGLLTEEDYCIGGALCSYYGLADTLTDLFPTRYELRDRLMQINPCLSEDRATEYACHIVRCNDFEQFEKGWAYAEGALAYKQGRGPGLPRD